MGRLFRSKWFLFFMILPFFNPTALKYIPGLTHLYDAVQIWKVAAILIIIVAYVTTRRYSMIMGWIILFELYGAVISWINGVYDLKVITNILLTLGISMLTEIALRIGVKAFIVVISKIAILLTVINFLLCLLYPNGLTMAVLYANSANPIYFLGIDNAMIKHLIPVFVLASLLIYYRHMSGLQQKWKSGFAVLIFISFVSLLITKSSTGIAVYFISVAFFTLYTFFLKQRYPVKLMLLGFFSFFIFIVVLDMHLNVVEISSGIFGKSATFTGRTSLWIVGLEKVLQHPLLGYGYTGGNIEIWGGLFSSHNLFIELMIQGGIPLLVIFMVMTLYAIREVSQSNYRYSNAILAGIFAFLLVGMFEVGVNYMYFLFLILACYPDFKPGERMFFLRITRGSNR